MLCQGTGGKNPTTDAPQRATTASSSGRMGHYRLPPVAYYYQPFSFTDILNWQRHAPLYSGKPQAMIRLMETIFRAHRPTWDDIIQLLVSLFSTKERHRILTEARKWLREMAPEGTANPQRWAELATPDERPSWDCNTEEGRGHLARYRAAILQGLKRGPQKPMNMVKPSEVIQRESESSSEFYKRLCKTYRLYRSRGCWVLGGDKCSLVSLACPKNVRWGGHQGTHEFLYTPECPVP